MPVTAVVGANWGDEGKGKITDYLASEADFVVRYQGGNNAGHTIINQFGKFALHLLPSGVFYPNVINVLGPGVAVNIPALLSEFDALLQRGVPRPDVRVSERAQILLPYHILFDTLEEERLGKESFGSTKSGIAPFYADKCLKIGLQVNELFDTAIVKARLAKAIVSRNVLLEKLYGKPPLSLDEMVAQLIPLRDRLAPFVTDTTMLLMDAVEAGKTVLVEGQLGTLRDPDHGIYPYPTSSSPLAGFAAVGAGVPPWSIYPGRCRHQGVFQLRGRGAVRHRAARGRGGNPAKEGGRCRGVWGNHGAPAARGLVRLRGNLLRVQGAGCHGSCNHEPRCPGVSGFHPRLYRVSPWRGENDPVPGLPIAGFCRRRVRGAPGLEDRHRRHPLFRGSPGSGPGLRSVHRREDPDFHQVDFRRAPARADDTKVTRGFLRRP